MNIRYAFTLPESGRRVRIYTQTAETKSLMIEVAAARDEQGVRFCPDDLEYLRSQVRNYMAGVIIA